MTSPLDDLPPEDLGARLQAARKTRGLTQEELAVRLGVARTTVTAIEKGQRRVRPGELMSLAGLLGRSIDELLAREVPAEPLSTQLRATLPPDFSIGEELDQPLFEFQRLCEDYRHLEEITGSARQEQLPELYRVDPRRPEASAEDAAIRERLRLGLGDGPIRDLRGLLETDVGLRIFYLDLPSRVAALFAFTTELGGAVAINRKHPPERRRHSLAHEYGHFLTKRRTPEINMVGRYARVPPQERFAEAFGRAFLLPHSGLVRRVHEIRQGRGGALTAADLLTLAELYCVSAQALTRRLEELDLIGVGTWDRLQQRGLQVREARPLPDLPERAGIGDILPPRYRLLAVEAFRTGALSEGQLARFLRGDRVEARRMADALAEGADADAADDLRGPLDFGIRV
jgi:Zn-dependent peptidase ImmA (M78 family)/transcriptional regulator with XRE-family HTH domain